MPFEYSMEAVEGGKVLKIVDRETQNGWCRGLSEAVPEGLENDPQKMARRLESAASALRHIVESNPVPPEWKSPQK